MAKLSPTRFLRKRYRAARNRLSGKSIINHRGSGVINLIDVGSMGKLPEPWASNLNYVRNILSFEPLEDTEIKGNIIKSSAALWYEKGPRPFYIYKGFKSSGSSLFQANIEYVNAHYAELRKAGPEMLAKTWYDRSELIRETEIECDTLDNVLEELPVTHRFDFLKIDAQGAEYEILRGAEKFLREDCLGLQLELFSIPLYKGIKLRSEVEALLSEFDFNLVKTFRPHGTFNSQNDCVYLKNTIQTGLDEKRRVLAEIYEL